MKDLIQKQTAALAQRGGSTTMYSPERLKSNDTSEQEVIDNDKKGSEAILKDIFSMLRKSYDLLDSIDENVLELLDSMKNLGKASRGSIVAASNIMQQKSAALPQPTPIKKASTLDVLPKEASTLDVLPKEASTLDVLPKEASTLEALPRENAIKQIAAPTNEVSNVIEKSNEIQQTMLLTFEKSTNAQEKQVESTEKSSETQREMLLTLEKSNSLQEKQVESTEKSSETQQTLLLTFERSTDTQEKQVESIEKISKSEEQMSDTIERTQSESSNQLITMTESFKKAESDADMEQELEDSGRRPNKKPSFKRSSKDDIEDVEYVTLSKAETEEKPSFAKAKRDDVIEGEYRTLSEAKPIESKSTATAEKSSMASALAPVQDAGLQQEIAAEAMDKVDRQIELLEIIATALTGKDQKKNIAPPTAEKEDEAPGPGIGKLLKGGMKGLLKGFAVTAIIGAVVNGVVDGFTEYSETGEIGKALIAGLGGVLDFLTFGLINKETLNNIINDFNSLVDEYIVAPISAFVDGVGKVFDEYIAQPIMSFVDTISDAFNEYIAEPIMAFAQWYYDTVSGIVMDYVVNPIKNFVTGLVEAFDTYIRKPFESMMEFVNKLNPFSSSDDKKKPVEPAMVPTYDQMGNVTGSEPAKVSAAPVNNSTAALTPATGAAPASAIYNSSANNAAAKESPAPAASAPIIVNAPTTVSNKQNVTMPATVRNQDPGFSAYRNKVM